MSNIPQQPTVVIVGAAGGIGLETVKQLHARARIFALVQDGAQAAQVGAAGAARCFECDLTDTQSTARALDAIDAAAGGKVDGLVITAGIQPVNVAEFISRGEIERVFAVNVFGGLQCVQRLLPGLLRSRGRVVFFSSMGGRLAAPMLGTYCSSKFALEGLADVLRRELAPLGVSVSLIEPGAVVTGMTAAQGELVERALEKIGTDGRARYEKMYRGYLAMTASVMPHALKADTVARLVCRVLLGTGRPRPRYVIGIDARIMLFLARVLPVRWMDALLAKASAGR